ncbi:MAG: nuoG [Rhodocyclaceae bacterium]|nr:nuoG [Rhodocyclaceae bacterium]
MSLYIDRAEYPAQPDKNLLEVCLSLGLDLPYFCWHPALGSVGACRQCAVKQFKDENDQRGRLVMACMTPAAEGTRISVDDPEARAFRAQVIEWLMTNHPHDCPVCDEGGECHLQDMTVMTGHTYRRCRAAKRTFRNQYLGPFVNHEMNRCITCYRCVRFYRDYAGGDDLEAQASRNRVYFGRAADGTLESEFSGNLVEVCPTGVFTDATLKQHYTRKWDLQNGPSLCPHCALGCNTLIGERYGEPRRVLNRYHHDINGYFLCDRGRYGYGFMTAPSRLSAPLLRPAADASLHPAAADEALAAAAALLREGAGIIGIGSPRASLEANFALRRLVGPERFFAGVGEAEGRATALILDLMRQLPVPVATLRQAEDSDAALVLGEDVLATAPRLGLALRQSTRHAALAAADRLNLPHWDAAAVQVAGRDQRSPLILATCASTRLDDAASATVHGPSDEIARFAAAVAHALDGSAPEVAGLDEARRQLAQAAAAALSSAQRPLVVAGARGGEALIRAAANIALALHRRGRATRLVWVLPECNSLGLALLAPRPLAEALAAAEAAGAPTAIVLENDLYRRAPHRAIDAFLAKARVAVIDHTRHATVEAAQLVLPAAAFADGSGTLVSSEGRAQRYLRAYPAAGDITDGWRWLGRLGALADGRAPDWQSLDEVTRACAAEFPTLAGIVDAAPSAAFRAGGRKIPRQPPRYSGRTAMRADRQIHEPPPPADPDSALAFSMEGHPGQAPAALLTWYRVPGWNSVQAVNKFQQEVGGELRGGDPGVRLLQADSAAAAGFLAGDAPEPFARRPGEWLLLPHDLIFCSEELSLLAPAVAQRAGPARLLLHPGDLQELGLADGDPAQVEAGGETMHLRVQPDPALAPGTAALPAGLPRLPWLDLPAWGSIRRVRG